MPANELAGVRGLLRAAADHAADFVESLPTRPVAAREEQPAISASLPEQPMAPEAVLSDLVAESSEGLTAFGSPRFFSFVIGGTLPVALAADWMTSAWDQNAGLASPSPATARIEEIAGEWLLDLLGLPAGASFALTTGCQMAHVTALAAARNRVLATAGWDVERDGLASAPRVRVLASEERHITIDRALRYLGFGTACVEAIPVDPDGAIDAGALAGALRAGDGPAIVCAQAGNVNTGAIDPLEPIVEAAREAGAWVHVDGAFGLWAAASPSRRGLLAGCERADSWATDAHKWLNVPYDNGLAVVADRAAHRASMAITAAYLRQAGEDGARDAMDWTLEFSRRARGVAVYAALRSLGRAGVAELVDRLCDCADRFAGALAALDGAEVLTHALNQVLVRFGDDDAVTEAVIARLQDGGVCAMSPTTWRGRRCMRISVCSWLTTPADVDVTLEAIAEAARRKC